MQNLEMKTKLRITDAEQSEEWNCLVAEVEANIDCAWQDESQALLPIVWDFSFQMLMASALRCGIEKNDQLV
jgi:hypothetical protein